MMMAYPETVAFKCDYCGNVSTGRTEPDFKAGRCVANVFLPNGWWTHENKQVCCQLCHAQFRLRDLLAEVKELKGESDE